MRKERQGELGEPSERLPACVTRPTVLDGGERDIERGTRPWEQEAPTQLSGRVTSIHWPLPVHDAPSPPTHTAAIEQKD